MSGAFDRLNSACLRHFGKPVTYTPVGGAAVVVTGVVSSGSRLEAAFPGTFAEVFVTEAALVEAGLSPAVGDAVVVEGLARRVVNVRRDAEGGVTIVVGA